MATDPGFIDYVLEQADFGARLTHKRMFGEYALYLDDKVVAFACDNSLFLKPTAQGRAALPTVTPGKPYPEAKDYYVLDEFLDDAPLLQRLLLVTADALPMPKPKKAAKRPNVEGAAGSAGQAKTAKASRPRGDPPRGGKAR